jgi:hypothetical protein
MKFYDFRNNISTTHFQPQTWPTSQVPSTGIKPVAAKQVPVAQLKTSAN